MAISVLNSLQKQDSLGNKFLQYCGETNDATGDETLIELPVDELEVYKVSAIVVATEEDGANRASYLLEATFYRSGGGSLAMQDASVNKTVLESVGDWDADLAIDGNSVELQVTGELSTNIRWNAQLSAYRSLSSASA